MGNKSWSQIAILLLMLVAIPVISYIYMKRGFDYQVQLQEELGDYGPMPDFSYPTITGDTITPDNFEGYVKLFHHIDTGNEKLFGDYLSELHEQFGEVDRIKFIMLLSNTQDRERAQLYRDKYSLNDTAQIRIVLTSQMGQPYDEAFKVPADKQNKPLVILADTSNVIRNYYDVSTGKQFVRLIEHVALLMPRDQEKKEPFIFNKDKEL